MKLKGVNRYPISIGASFRLYFRSPRMAQVRWITKQFNQNAEMRVFVHVIVGCCWAAAHVCQIAVECATNGRYILSLFRFRFTVIPIVMSLWSCRSQIHPKMSFELYTIVLRFAVFVNGDRVEKFVWKESARKSLFYCIWNDLSLLFGSIGTNLNWITKSK